MNPWCTGVCAAGLKVVLVLVGAALCACVITFRDYLRWSAQVCLPWLNAFRDYLRWSAQAAVRTCHFLRVVSLTSAGIKEKNRLPYFKGGTTSDFIEFYDRLTAIINAKGKRWRQALHSVGPFRGYSFQDLVASENDDDVDDLRPSAPEESILNKEGSPDPGKDDGMPLLEVTRDTLKKEKSDEKRSIPKPEITKSSFRVPIDDRREFPREGEDISSVRAVDVSSSERGIQSLYLAVCRQMHSLILQCLAPEPHRQLRNYGCQAGDGPVAHRLLRKIYQGTGSVALIKLIKALVSLKMEGKFLQLRAYGSEFRRCAVSISSLGYNLDENVLKALHLIGLSSSCESVISTIANAGFDKISLESLKESVRVQRDFLESASIRRFLRS